MCADIYCQVNCSCTQYTGIHSVCHMSHSLSVYQADDCMESTMHRRFSWNIKPFNIMYTQRQLIEIFITSFMNAIHKIYRNMYTLGYNCIYIYIYIYIVI